MITSIHLNNIFLLFVYEKVVLLTSVTGLRINCVKNIRDIWDTTTITTNHVLGSKWNDRF